MKKIIYTTILIISLVATGVLLTAMTPIEAHAQSCSCDVDDSGCGVGNCTATTTSDPKEPVLISARSGYLTDSESGRVLYAKGENERYEIASMVKIMTALLAFEHIDKGTIKLSDMVTISNNAAKQTGSELFIDEGQSYSVHDLIKGVIVVSANDASVAIAERIAGSEDAFVSMMNERAAALGMKDTLFVNTTGLPQGTQYSTARDVNTMTRALLAHKEYYKYSSIWLEDYTHPSGRITQLANTNKLIRFYKGCDSGKTGYTDSAKFCLSASAKRGDMRVVATLLGGEDSKARFREVSSMLDYAFANYKRVNIMTIGEQVGQNVAIVRGRTMNITPIVSRNISALIKRGESTPTVSIELPDKVSAPLAKGDKLGVARLIVGDSEIDCIDLISPSDVAKATFWDYVKKITR